ncbi:MAG: hypothetical protein IJ378_00090 [Alistipes sp.]|nr:hypothetical protein [Alistipes sp.]MBO5276779.1 hypothetical protein [Alistipes sp.]MBO5332023.1 hypothetical protein [Alistipes sp.]MBQ7786550.1 hypothetical protein [Alistipes sp.]
MKTKILFSILLSLLFLSPAEAQKRLLFDLSHGQCKGRSYLGDVVPDYRRMAADNGAEFVINENQPLTAAILKGVDVVLMLSPLQHDLQKDITPEEAEALVKFIKRGGALLVFVDEESHRTHLDKYNINAVTKPFGIEFGDDNPIPSNCGAVSFINDIFSARHEVPCSGMRSVKGGTPASVCMEDGYLHSTYIKLKNGGKLFACSETMVGLLMGGGDVERKARATFNKTDWFGKDSYKYMEELIAWAFR